MRPVANHDTAQATIARQRTPCRVGHSGAVGPEDSVSAYAGQRNFYALLALNIFHLEDAMVRGESTAVWQGCTRVGHDRDEEGRASEEQAQVPVVEVVLPQRRWTAVMTDAYGVHKAHALQGKPTAAAAAAVHAATATAMVAASYEVELGAATPAIGGLSVGCPRRLVQMERTELFVTHCDDSEAALGPDQLLLGSCHCTLYTPAYARRTRCTPQTQNTPTPFARTHYTPLFRRKTALS